MKTPLNIFNLKECFKRAQEIKAAYVGVVIEMPNMQENEIIINPTKNFQQKLEYYTKSYNADLSHKHAEGIRIIGFTYGDNYEDIQNQLVRGTLNNVDIHGNIKEISYMRMGKKTTVCMITTKSGFEIIGTSACVDPKNYDNELGKKYAFKNAKRQLEEFEGYRISSK